MSNNRELKITASANYITLKAPVTVPTNWDVVLPDAPPVGTEVLTMDPSGQLAYGGAVGTGFATQVDLDATQAEVDALEILHAQTQTDLDTLEATVAGMGGGGGETLQQTYDLGEDITLTTGKSITFTQPLNEATLVLNKSGTGAGVVLDIQDVGSGHSISITKTSGVGGRSIDIVHNAASFAAQIVQQFDAVGVYVNKTATGAGTAFAVGNSGTGDGVGIAQAGNGKGLAISKSGTGAGTALEITNAGTGSGIQVTQTNAGIGVNISQGANTEGLFVNKTNTGAGGAASVTNAGSGFGVQVTCTTGTPAKFLHSGAGAARLIDVETTSGTGIFIATNAGGTIGTTGAKLTNAGVWTNGTCFAHTKTDIAPVADEGFWLDNLDKLQLVRWVGEKAPDESPVLSPLQDELVTYFGFDPNRGTAGHEIATVALVCLRALHERFKAAVLRITALEAAKIL